MEFFEKDLEQIIYETNNENLIERGLYIRGLKKRQVKIGNYGIADLIVVKRYYDEDYFSNGDIEPYLQITVYELKKEKIGISAFLQAVNYARGLQRYFENKKYRVLININLIGKEIDISGSFCYLTDLFSELEIYTYKYEFDGIEFEKHSGYYLKNEGF